MVALVRWLGFSRVLVYAFIKAVVRKVGLNRYILDLILMRKCMAA